MRSLRPLLPLALIALSAPASAFASANGGAAYPGTGGTGATGGSTSLPGSTAPSGQAETGLPGSRSPGQEQQSPGEGSGGATPGAGGSNPTATTPATPVSTPTTAVLLTNGKVRAPKTAPASVKKAIRAANKLIGKPYVFGGGHQRWTDAGYDCSGAVSYALHGARLLTSSLDSSMLMTWGKAGAGKWITVYANPDHTFVVIAGVRFDTGATGDRGPRWSSIMRPTGNFTARHPNGL